MEEDKLILPPHHELFLLYCSIVSMQFHPGAERDGKRRLTPKECSAYTVEYYWRFANIRRDLWRGSDQQSVE